MPTPRRAVRPPALALLAAPPLLAGCVDDYLGYPRTPPAGVAHAVETMEHGALRVRLELLEVEGAGHVFNFRDAAKATAAWATTLAFLERHLAPAAPPAGP